MGRANHLWTADAAASAKVRDSTSARAAGKGEVLTPPAARTEILPGSAGVGVDRKGKSVRTGRRWLFATVSATVGFTVAAALHAGWIIAVLTALAGVAGMAAGARITRRRNAQAR